MSERKVGRPRTTEKAGLHAGDSRATFVVEEQLWHELRDYQNTSSYRTMKSLMADMITKFLEENGDNDD